MLTWKLDFDEHGKPVPGNPQALLDAEVMAKRSTERMVVLASRGWGKTFYTLIKLFEECLQKPNRHCAFVTKSKIQAKGNIRLSAETILEDCPDDLRPRFLKNDACYEFTNGSTLTLLGVDSERFDTIRGRAFHGVAIDESQSIDQLETIVRVVLDPCVMRVSGWMMLTGTVPETGEHDFIRFIEDARATRTLVKKTILENPRYTQQQIQKAKERAGGETSDIWVREYLCELRFSSNRRVIPEWTPEREVQLTRDPPVPDYRDLYVGLDFAFSRDLTVALFGYVDFLQSILVIEDELTLKPSTTAVMAAALQEKERALWGPEETRQTVSRWADGNEARTIHELRTEHRLAFRATDKKAKLMAINTVRMLIASGRLFISPRCELLIRTLSGAAWDKNHKQFGRDDEIGHADALDALVYLARNVVWTKNPFPTVQHWTGDGHIAAKPASSAVKALRGAFGGASTSIRAEVNRRLGKIRR